MTSMYIWDAHRVFVFQQSPLPSINLKTLFGLHLSEPLMNNRIFMRSVLASFEKNNGLERTNHRLQSVCQKKSKSWNFKHFGNRSIGCVQFVFNNQVKIWKKITDAKDGLKCCLYLLKYCF